MNSSTRETGDASAIAEWLQQYPYPHCKKAQTLSSLRTGIAIAEVLTDKLPDNYHPLFLPHIQIYNISTQRCIMNLKVLLTTLSTFSEHHPDLQLQLQDFTPQGLYYDHNMMETFIYTVMMVLPQNYSDHAANSIIKPVVNYEQAIDIANLSSIMINADIKDYKQHQLQVQLPQTKPQLRSSQSTSNDQQVYQNIKVLKWLWQTHHINAEDLSPQQILGNLVNSMFAGSRLDNSKIVKQCHYELGAVVVFKKISDYLLNCQRMPKQNVLAMLQNVQSGCLREQVFWGVVQDLMNIKISHHLKNSRSRKKSIIKNPSSRDLSPNKENLQKQCQNQIKKEVFQQFTKNKIIQIPEYDPTVIIKAEEWIKNQMGYEYSLNKGKNVLKKQQNPILNGVLLGSIIMRMQLGKMNIIKQPKNKQEIDRNIAEVANCIIRRGLQSGRKFFSMKPSYRNYLGIIWDAKIQLQKKNKVEKNHRAELQKEKKHINRQISEDQKRSIVEWLSTKTIEIDSLQNIPTSKISEICGQILQLRLFRQTTKRIKQSNMQKIITQLRRLGWQGETSSQQIMSEQGNSLRWSMLKFTHQLVKHKVYYYR